MSGKKSTKLPVLSQSRDLVPVGPRQVQAKHHGKRDENGLRPSTSRALVLRNGKYGTYGTGELVLASRISGREKLDLLAEDLLSQRARTAIMAPLQLEKCIKIADSQFNAYLDDVATLKDAELFYDKILDEIVARTPQGSAKGVQDALSNASYVASVVATRIHNAHMIASGWRIVLDMLRGLVKSGLKDGTAHRQLQKDEGLRSRYLVLCDIVNVLADLGQMQFSVLATTTPHYSRYFKIVENVPVGEPEIAFDWGGLKDVCKSFLDSIIIELCFPRAPYPKRILLQILHDAVDESPREAKRFPQKMWDAVGDLSVTLELQELLESPLLGPEREKLKALPRKMPERYELWLDAQFYSKQASECYDNFKDIISPLEATRDQAVLDQLWGVVDTNYSRASDVSIDALWQLDDAYRRTPQWTAHYTPELATFYDSDDSDAVRSLVKVRHPRKNAVKKPQKKVLTITDGRDDGVDCDSMPELQSVSESPGETDEYTDSDEQGEVDDEDQESEYESEEEDLYRTMLREAMDAALAIPEFFDPKANVPDFEAMAEERKENPFLKLLSSLRGRMFSSDAKLSAAARAEPREGRFGAKLPTVKGAGKVAPAFTVSFAGVPDDDLPPLQPLPTPREKRVPKRLCRKSFIIPDPSRLTPPAAPQPPQDRRAAVEEVEDEEDAPSVASKKKKKKPKKKRAETCGVGTVPEAEASTTNLTSARSPAGSTLKSSMGRPLLSDGHVALHGYASTTSLPIEPTTAKSGHAYLQELGMPKEKIKSRPDHASLFSDKKGFLSKLSGGDKAKEKTEPKQSNSNANTSTWFSRLRKKTAGYMQQLLHPGEEKQGGLKWESFLKVMREMGFSCDPSTAGSSVRFDPPNKRDKSITFHKRAVFGTRSYRWANLSVAHPDPTLHPHKLREFGKRLKEYYGWSEEDFLKRTANA
ncbi:hypothetical protein M404DRAFT_21860 [Pisolithus tinctorius Marx 270]|uniref:Uncharacterized protein n=1 Tax=Pisolithus tinctorius Marx 270 TaxID=870435 RepID=A0A0C3P9H5_PISTI|nr:hypothetical protein M404DRAFT_21860 [Pisolithus tinctorius Marx 270]